MFSFGLSSVISKVFVADFEHVFFFLLEKAQQQNTIAVQILKYLAQQTNTYSNIDAETLKANSKDCASLLTTCSMSKTLFKYRVYYEHAFVYCDVSAVTISFLIHLLSILNRFHTLSTFVCYQFCIESRRSPKGVLQNYGIFSEKRLCQGLFLIKLSTFRTANILKRDSNSGVSCEICENFQQQIS